MGWFLSGIAVMGYLPQSLLVVGGVAMEAGGAGRGVGGAGVALFCGRLVVVVIVGWRGSFLGV